MRRVCVLIHGFAGGRRETAALGRTLDEAGYEVCSVLLAGHEADRAQMARTGYDAWLNSAREQIKKSISSEDTHDDFRLCVVGFSMGGLIAASLAREFPVDALVFINTPIYFWDIRRVLINVFSDLRARKFVHTRRYLRAGMRIPLRSMISFIRLLRKAKPCIGDISTPALILQCRDDDTTNQRSAEYIRTHLGGEASVVYYDTGGHSVLEGPRAAEACADVAAFLRIKE